MAALLPSQQTEKQKKALAAFFATGAMGARSYRNNWDDREWYDEDFRMDGGKCWKSCTTDRNHEDDWQEITFSAAVDRIAELAAEGWSMRYRSE